MQFKDDVEAVDALRDKYKILTAEIGKVIIGQNEVVEDVLICVLSKGHCLLVGVPGLAKTLLVNTISRVLGLQYSRIQFTPDLMPSDIIGTEILDESRQFRFVKGPLFANIILADEINRTPPKTQAALLEAMQERAVTTAGKRYELGNPFFVLATQNPIEQEGTYPLPEAQLDRFMFNVWLSYPKFEEEITVVKNTTSEHTVGLKVVLSSEEILYYQDLIRRVPVTDNVLQYAVRLAASTRPGIATAPPPPEGGNAGVVARAISPLRGAGGLVDQYISWGAGPRASQYLILGAKAHAVIHGKYSPDIEDVRAVAPAILRHRIVRNYKAEAENVSADAIIKELLR